MAEKFLDKVYETSGDDATRKLYDAWSGSYDDEVTEHGYRTPRRLALAMADHANLSLPLLDYGCGTGLSGASLYGAGFTQIDGADPSQGMLDQARGRAFYRNLVQLDLSQPLPFKPGQYSSIAAIGVISTGAGPASLMQTLIDLLPSGGHLGFSLNDHALEDPDYPSGVAPLAAAAPANAVADSCHQLPRLHLSSMIYFT